MWRVLSHIPAEGSGETMPCVITDAGGPGVMLTDELERQGFSLPVLGEHTRERLKGILPAESSVMNPIDCLPSRTGPQMRQIFQVMAEEESRAH